MWVILMEKLSHLYKKKIEYIIGSSSHCIFVKASVCGAYVCKERIVENIFEKTLIEVCSLNLYYASFGTFCSQIDQIFEAQWVFELSLKIDNSPSSKENVVDFGILPNV